MQNAKTKSDGLFETYLSLRGLPWDYEPATPGKTTRIDYRVTANHQTFFFEVKEFSGTSPATSYDAIREKINEAQKQIKQYKEYCCSLVVSAPNGTVDLGPAFVLGAMLGDVAVAWDVPIKPALPVQPAGRRFGMRGKMIRPGAARTPQNRTISAILVLDCHDVPTWRAEITLTRLERELGRCATKEEFEEMAKGQADSFQDVPRVVVFENPDARRPLPRNLFDGPYDERWGPEGNDIVRVFVGSEIQQLERGSKES